MSRLLLLAILVLWMCPRDNIPEPHWAPVEVRTGLFLGAYALLTVFMALWSRLLSRRLGGDSIGRTLDRYNRATEFARYFVPVWFAIGLFGLGWGHVVAQILPLSGPYRTPGLLLGTLPAFAAWMGLWWAQYPAERALREQSLLFHADEGLPIHAPPGFATFFVEHFRQQLLFTLAPILLIVAARDLLAAGAAAAHVRIARDASDILFLPVALGVFVLAPEILRRVIPTTPLPADWPLRRRLEALCRRAGLKYREILLWRTNSSMGNAMVMGLLPQVRYVFLSDLLLETMRDEEIEAVFAHEIGHIVHGHMWWYVVFTLCLMLFSMGPMSVILDQVPGLAITPWMSNSRADEVAALQEQVAAGVGLVMFGVLFGCLSRRFERQADVYAARTMQAHRDRPAETVIIRHANPEAGVLLAGGASGGVATAAAVPIASMGPPIPEPLHFHTPSSHVGEYGAGVVASALHRVARINNIPVAAGEWLHGSIASRMRYLHELSAHDDRTQQFDRYMKRLNWALVTIFFALAAWVGVQYALGG